jgi:hypothetical protein
MGSKKTKSALGLKDVAASSDKSLVTEISYCPCLGIYHYLRSDGVEFFFTWQQLEDCIETYLRSGHHADAQFMAEMTGRAREAPHLIVVVAADGKGSFRKPEQPHPEPPTEEE